LFDIPEELKKLPKKPGVYIMKDESGKIIYVGKAINLYNRVRQYFQASSAQTSPKVYFMAPQIREFEYILVDGELEALILENNLIKKHNPRFNIKLKDDKGYPYIKVTVNERFPRFFLARRHEKDRARYFGPYIGGTAVRETLELMHRLWPIRTCPRKFPRDIGKERPCLNHYIGQCLAPCTGSVSEEEYGALVEEAMQFLNGKYEKVLKRLEAGMLEAAENLEFEKAAEMRDKIRTIRALSEKQKIDGEPGDDQDIAALARKDGEALAQVFFIRGGKMIGREHFSLGGGAAGADPGLSGLLSDGEIMTEFVKRFYGEAAFIPREIILEHDVEAGEKDVIVKWLSGLKGQNVTLTVPKRGEKLKLVQMAANNAAQTLEQFGEHMRREKEKTEGAVAEIARALGFGDAEIRRIEAYDISNIQGFESVASMVVFENGKPKNSDYRKFRLRNVLGPDDYAGMEEVIGRRFARYRLETENPGPDGGISPDGGQHRTFSDGFVPENEDGDGKENAPPKKTSFSRLPDIVFIDGGKGQAGAAEKAMRALDIDIPVCGMVKDDRHRTRGLLYEGEEVTLPAGSEGFKLVTRIQDEVHRFAVEYHRKLRANAQVKSVLDEIPGIGPNRRKELMKKFKSLEAIKEADTETLAGVKGMNARAAEAVREFFRGK